MTIIIYNKMNLHEFTRNVKTEAYKKIHILNLKIESMKVNQRIKLNAKVNYHKQPGSSQGKSAWRCFRSMQQNGVSRKKLFFFFKKLEEKKKNLQLCACGHVQLN